MTQVINILIHVEGPIGQRIVLKDSVNMTQNDVVEGIIHGKIATSIEHCNGADGVRAEVIMIETGEVIGHVVSQSAHDSLEITIEDYDTNVLLSRT